MKKLKKLWQVPDIRAYLMANLLLSLTTGWFFGIYSVFLTQKIGLSLAQANLINTVYMLLSTLLDPYTGNLADRVGQKKVYIWGQFWWSLGMLTYGFSKNFWQCIVAESAAAIGHALMSQALETWLRNRLGEEKSHEAISFEATIRLVSIPTAMVGSIIGARYGLEWPFRLSGIMGLVTCLITAKMLWRLPDEDNGGQTEPSLKEAIGLVARNQRLRKYLAITFAYSMAVQPINMFWGPIMAARSGSVAWLGSMWLPISVLSAWGGQIAAKKKNLKLAVILTAVPILLAASGPSIWFLVGGFLLHQIGRGMINPVLFTLSNRYMPNHIRSTASSIMSSGKTAGGVSGLLISGYLSTIISPLQVWVVAGVWLMLMVIVAKVVSKR